MSATAPRRSDEGYRDAKKQWIQKMIKSAKLHHKICPFYDRKKKFCFIKLGERCQYDGKFDNCPTFIEFLEKRFDEIVNAGKPLPNDFEDPLVQFGVT
ncbi:MAG: hypothetical protein QW775_00520 [Ignisphaera sp.]|uniref:Uncharacterized protein n=1 Tax=Ignisphaera aggregans TaxID=334771 RepID=A0A7C4JJJ0_9CREN